MQGYKILFKYPSRGRKDRFFDGLDSIVNNLHDLENFHISCTLDEDDTVMNDKDVIAKINEYPNTTIEWGKSNSKINAINRSMPNYDWDIVVNHADDMRFIMYGFDVLIRNEFNANGLDTLLHIPDQDAKEALATMYIAGKDYYNRLGFIYNEAYQSLFCDNEAQESAQQLGCYRFAKNCYGVLKHLNSAYGYLERDEMFNRQQEIGWSLDMQTYHERKKINFGL